MSEAPGAPSPTYALNEKAGATIFGTVWRGTATDPDGEGRPVLITVLDTRVSREASFLGRVNKDRPALDALRNPNIGLIEAIVPVNGLPAAVTTEVPGKDLAELLQAGPMPPRASAELALELAWALHAAHGALSDDSIRPLELSHGAIVPANVRVTGAGEVVLPDYGLHRAMHPNEPTATDVLALGCLLYACLTGGSPTLAANGPDEVPAVIQRALAALDPSLPIELRDLIGQCFAPNPDARPSTRDVARRLRQVIPVLDGAWLPTWADEKIGGAPRERPRVQEQPFLADEDASEARAKRREASEGDGEKKRQPEADNVLRPLKKATVDPADAGPDKRQIAVFIGILLFAIFGSGAFALRRLWLPYFGAANGADVPTDQAGPDKAAAAGPVTVKRSEPGAEAPDVASTTGGGPVTIIEEEAGIEAKDEGAAPRPEREIVATDQAINAEPTEAPPSEGDATAAAAADGMPEVGPPPWPRPPGTLGEHDVFVEVALARSVTLRCVEALELQGNNPERVAMMQIPDGKCTIEARFPPDETATATFDVIGTTDLICRIGLPGQLRCVPRDAPRPKAPEPRDAAAGEPVDIELRVPLARAIELSCQGGRERSATMRERVMMDQLPAGPCTVKAILPDGDYTGTFQANRSKSVICLRADSRGGLRCSDAIPLP